MPRNKDRGPGEINAGSMADIAFLLLIFFLVTTTMKVDKGLLVKLPPWPKNEDEIENVEVEDRNTLKILINSRDQLLVEGDELRIEQLKKKTKRFIANPHNRQDFSESPQKAVVSLKNDRGTSYDMYIQVYNELKAAYNELRNEKAQEKFGKPYTKLNKEQTNEIRDIYPIKISEAEPTKFGE
jgi:biopolymer transport protein ExbD